MHIFAKSASLTKCTKCGKPVLPHTICLNCGYYKGVEMIDVMAKLTKKEKKQKEKEIKDQQKSGKKEMSMEEMSKK